jgi:hypothetical protein
MAFKNMVILAVIWCALVVPNAVFYFVNKDAKLKRKIHPWWMWGIGVTMMVASVWLGRAQMNLPIFLFIIAINAAFSFYYTKAIVFCDTCGKTMFRLYPFQKTAHCSRCAIKDSKEEK